MNTLLIVLALFCSSAYSGKNFCKPLVDYTPRYDIEVVREICSTQTRKVVEEKTEAACLEVINMECDVIVVPECTTTVTKELAMMDIPAIKEANLTRCSKQTVMKDHIKEVYDCQNVTKTHCTTLWELDDQGNKVWAGNNVFLFFLPLIFDIQSMFSPVYFISIRLYVSVLSVYIIIIFLIKM